VLLKQTPSDAPAISARVRSDSLQLRRIANFAGVQRRSAQCPRDGRKPHLGAGEHDLAEQPALAALGEEASNDMVANAPARAHSPILRPHEDTVAVGAESSGLYRAPVPTTRYHLPCRHLHPKCVSSH
jgi:hypothetical protein